MLLPNRMRKLLPKLRIRFSLTPAALCWRRAALRSGHRAIELKPDYAAAYLPDANQAQAEIYEKLGQRDKVIADYHQALSLAPNMTSAQDRLNSFKSRSAPNRSMAHEIGSSGVKIIMKTTFKLHLACLALVILAFTSPSMADTEKRIAFVVGNSAYQAGQLATSANDAGLIAQTLQAAGFDVTGARDLDGESLRAAFRDFLDKAQASGPDTMAFVYLAGYGLQLDGENYFVPVDAKIASAQDVAVEALRVSDYTKRLAGLPLKASLIVLDAARDTPFAKSGPPLAGGLALADAEPNMLVAFNATPGTVAPTESGPYGAYARGAHRNDSGRRPAGTGCLRRRAAARKRRDQRGICALGRIEDHGALRLFRAGGGRAASSPRGGAGRCHAVAAPPRAWRAGRLCRRDRARYAARL